MRNQSLNLIIKFSMCIKMCIKTYLLFVFCFFLLLIYIHIYIHIYIYIYIYIYRVFDNSVNNFHEQLERTKLRRKVL